MSGDRSPPVGLWKRKNDKSRREFAALVTVESARCGAPEECDVIIYACAVGFISIGELDEVPGIGGGGASGF